ARLARRLRRRRPPPLSVGRRPGARRYAGGVVHWVPVGARSPQGRVPQLALGSRWLRGGRARVPGRCRCGAPWPRGAARRRVHHRPGTARRGGSLELVAGNTRRRPVRLGGSATGPILELPRRDRRVYSGSMSPSHRIFLLSPAHCSGKRAGFLLRKNARSTLAQRLRSSEGATIGEVFTFMSGLYFRGKLAYASAFANPPEGCSGVQVIVPGVGLCPPRATIDLAGLRAIAQV